MHEAMRLIVLEGRNATAVRVGIAAEKFDQM
jgi:hypothetical protein